MARVAHDEPLATELTPFWHVAVVHLYGHNVWVHEHNGEVCVSVGGRRRARTHTLRQCRNLSSDANVSANSLPAQHATTKVQCPPYLSAQRSICSAQGQQPPQGVYRWRTKGLPGSSRSLRWTASVRALAARGRRTASVNGLTVRTRSMGGSTSTINEVCASGVVPGVDFPKSPGKSKSFTRTPSWRVGWHSTVTA